MTTGETFAELSNKTVSAANGIEYVYRDAGEGGVPPVLVQHFRGNLDNWDPALIDDQVDILGFSIGSFIARKRRTLATCVPADPARDDRCGGR
jgi:hypothetical protein